MEKKRPPRWLKSTAAGLLAVSFLFSINAAFAAEFRAESGATPQIVTGIPQFNNWLVSLNTNLNLAPQDLAAISYHASQVMVPTQVGVEPAPMSVRYDPVTAKIEFIPQAAQTALALPTPAAIELSNLPQLRQNLEQSGEAAKGWLEGLKNVSDPQALAGSLNEYFDRSAKASAPSALSFDPQERTAQVLSSNLPANVRPRSDDPEASARHKAALVAWQKSPNKTYVLVNSYSFKDDGTPGLNYYDMRPLAQILWAADPHVNVVFVTAMPVDEAMINHVLNGHKDAVEIRKRVHFVSLNDEGTDFLSQKLLDPKHADKLTEIRSAMERSGAPAVLYPYMGGPYEWQIAKELGIPDSVYASHPSKIYWGTKSGGRKVFKAAMARYTGTPTVRIKIADGAEDVYDVDNAAKALEALQKRHPELAKVAVKLNLGSSGEGNLFPGVWGWDKMTHEERKAALLKKLTDAKVGIPNEKGEIDNFETMMANEGAAIEQFIPGIDRATFPSVQSEILPDGSVRILSSHEQILVDRNNYVGATLSANKAYRKVVERAAYEAAVELSKRGIVGRFGTDFAAVPQADGSYDIYYIENNIRLTGTTHPLVAAAGLTGGSYDGGALRKADERGSVRYKSMDHDVRPNLLGLDVDGFLAHFDKEENHSLLFDPDKRSGVLFHLLPAVKAAGNVGYTIIARTREAVQAIQDRLTESLNRLEVEYLSEKNAADLNTRFTGHDVREQLEEQIGHAVQVKQFKAFLDRHHEHLFGRGSASGIVFHPHGFTVVGANAAELDVLTGEANDLLDKFAQEATAKAP
jgi:hypothetical protein